MTALPIPRPIASLLDQVQAWRDERLADLRHTDRLAAVLGASLGICLLVCSVTGILSHLIQHPASWFFWPTHPASLFHITQGLHIATGIAAVPLRFAKLWAVFPRLFQVAGDDERAARRRASEPAATRRRFAVQGW